MNRDKERWYTARQVAEELGFDIDAVNNTVRADLGRYPHDSGPCGLELGRAAAERLVADLRAAQGRPRSDTGGAVGVPTVFSGKTGQMVPGVWGPGDPDPSWSGGRRAEVH